MLNLPTRRDFLASASTAFAVVASADEPKDAPAVPPTDWPRWRGPNADGVADNHKLTTKWSKTQNVLWSAKLPGWGTSSPVVFGDRVFVTSQVSDNGKKSLLTLCFGRADGKELWRQDFGFGVDQKTHEKSNLAVNTPAVTEDAVYVAFGNADIARYTHDGKLVWVARYLKTFDDPKMAWGYAISPLVLPDSVLFPWNHHKGPCYLIGLDKKSGEIAWKKERPIGTAHATPLLVEHHGQTDILVPGQNRLTAFDAKTHAELWKYGEGEGPYNGEIISSPAFGDGMVFCQLWRESRIHALRLAGKGKPPESVWVSKKPGPVEPSLLYYRGLVYAMMDNGLLVCLDGKTGEEHYRERLKGTFHSSPVASDGNVFVSNNDGATFVVKAGKEFEVVATNELGERITASPAITGNTILYRTDSRLYCVGRRGNPKAQKTITEYFRKHRGTVYLCVAMDADNQKPYGRCAWDIGRTAVTFSAPYLALTESDAMRTAVIAHELAHVYRRGSGEWTENSEVEERDTRVLARRWGYLDVALRDEAHRTELDAVEAEWLAEYHEFRNERESRWLGRWV